MCPPAPSQAKGTAEVKLHRKGSKGKTFVGNKVKVKTKKNFLNTRYIKATLKLNERELKSYPNQKKKFSKFHEKQCNFSLE